MKKLLGYLVILFLAATVPVLPLGAADPVYFEGEGFVVPTENSQSGLETDFRLRQGDPTESTVQVSVISGEFPNIEVLAKVLDGNGVPVTNLEANDFEILEQSENEATQTVQVPQTCPPEISPTGPGIAFSLAFDVSQSMSFNDRLSDSKVAATAFLAAATDPVDRGSLVSFSGCDQGGVVVPLTTVGTDGDGDGTTDLAAGINGLAAISLTALFDGISDALDTLDGASSPKGVIVFTDGQSNADCRGVSMDQVIQKAQAASTPVYTIGLALNSGSPAENQLIRIAQETGGSYALAPTAADMTEIYQDIADTIRSQYRLCYTTHNPVFDGTERFVTVNADGFSGEGSYTVGGTAENRPPVVLHNPVTTAMAGQSIDNISAAATDPDAGDSVVSMALFYRPQGGNPDDPYQFAAMTPGEGDTWNGQIPGTAVTLAGLEYYLQAEDTQMAQGLSGNALNPFPVTVTAPAPVAAAGPDQSVTEGETAVLSGGASTTPLPDGFLAYSWEQVGGPVVALNDADTASPNFVAPDVGPGGEVFTFSLTVTDSAGRTDTNTVAITVNPAQAPESDFTFFPADPVSGDPIQFTDQSSTPTGAAITAWAWDFGGLETSPAPNPAFTFPNPGTYTVSLAVTDANGIVGSFSREIIVAEPPDVDPPCVEGDCGGGGSGGCFLQSISDSSSGTSALRKIREILAR